MSHRSLLRPALAFGSAASAPAAVPDAAAAKIVTQAQLSQYCAGEASGELGAEPTNRILLPVKKTHGEFHVYGKTNEAEPTLFECTFDGKGNHEHGSHAARVAQVSPLRSLRDRHLREALAVKGRLHGSRKRQRDQGLGGDELTAATEGRRVMRGSAASRSAARL